MKKFAILLVTALALACGSAASGTAASGATTQAPAPTFESGACPPELAGHHRVACGTLLVHDAAHGKGWADVRLAVAVVHAASATPKPDPIVFLHGGPGGDAVRNAANLFETSALAQDRDVIVMDQRGGGLSEPNLACPEVEQVDWHAALARPENDPATLASARRARQQCHDRLVRTGLDPRAVSTTTIAGDVAALRTALGIRAWNVLGFSYGGRVALTLLRDHPQGIRSVVLDAPAPPGKSLFDPDRIGSALGALFAACERSAPCKTRHPDLRGEWTTLRARIADAPETVAVTATDAHPAGDVAVDEARLMNAAIGMLFNPATISTLPDLIATPGLRAIAAEAAASGNDETGPIGAYLAVVCSEDSPIPVRTPDRAVTGAFPGNATFGTDCQGWQARPASPTTRMLPRTRVPALVMHGEFDPAVPTAWARQVGNALHAQVVQFPGLSHGVVNGDNPCGVTLAAAFVADPKANVDTSCVKPSELP